VRALTVDGPKDEVDVDERERQVARKGLDVGEDRRGMTRGWEEQEEVVDREEEEGVVLKSLVRSAMIQEKALLAVDVSARVVLRPS
jgi:hypothetical protein